MAYIVMAYILMAYIVMAYMVMAYRVMAYIVMAVIVWKSRGICRAAHRFAPRLVFEPTDSCSPI